MQVNVVNILLMVIPLLFSGITFIFIKKFKFLKVLEFPLDYHITFKKKRILGDNKTFKGPIVMSIMTALYGTLIYSLFTSNLTLSISFKYFIIGLLYSLGELPNSFFKRQLDIAPGEKSRVFHQKYFFGVIDTLDSIVVCCIGYAILFNYNVEEIVATLVIGGGLHLLTDQLMILLRIKKK